jgi:hypothetical protein
MCYCDQRRYVCASFRNTMTTASTNIWDAVLKDINYDKNDLSIKFRGIKDPF